MVCKLSKEKQDSVLVDFEGFLNNKGTFDALFMENLLHIYGCKECQSLIKQAIRDEEK